MLVGFVVFVLPGSAAAVAFVGGDGDQALAALGMVRCALHQFRVAGGAAPVTLDAGAGLAEQHFFQFVLAVRVQ